MRRHLARCLVALFLLAASSPASALQRCATPSPSQEVKERVRRVIAGRPGLMGGGTIMVAFHVVHNGTRGNVPQSWIDAQIQVLTNAFDDLGVTFELGLLDRTLNTQWFNLEYDSPEEMAMKQALAYDPAHYLNVYSVNPVFGYLGWATFPFDLGESDPLSGVVILYDSMPGGSADPYNGGDTATHEVGHWLGLYHTFENGCVAPDDEVADTPRENGPNFGCPSGIDTCPQPGLDPIHNFMDYTDDDCMNEFTLGQFSRMDAIIEAYRPNLIPGGPTAASHDSWGGLKIRYR